MLSTLYKIDDKLYKSIIKILYSKIKSKTRYKLLTLINYTRLKNKNS